MAGRQTTEPQLKPSGKGGHNVTLRTDGPANLGAIPAIDAGDFAAADTFRKLRDAVLLVRLFLVREPGQERPMTPERVKAIRDGLGLSQPALGRLLRLGASGKRTVARWESGEVNVPGPVSVALEALESGWRPGDGRWSELRQAYLTVLDAIDEAVSQARTQVQAVGAPASDEQTS